MLGKKHVRLLLSPNYMVWFLIAVVYFGFFIMAPSHMLSSNVFKSIIWYALPVGLLALAEGVALLSGNFDISVGQGAGLAAMLAAVTVTGDLSIGPFSLVVPIAFGVILGIINGILVGFLSLNAFLVTLGSYLAFGGVTLLVSSHSISSGFPEGYLLVGGNFFVSVVTFLGILILVSILIYKTRFGIHLLCVGSNKTAAKSLGINTNRMTFYAFTLVGFLVGAAALMYTGYVSSVPTTLADGSIFLAAAAAVLGGISLSGGKGLLPNAVGGAILLSLIGTGLIMARVSPFFVKTLYGLIVIFAVVIDRIREKVIGT